MKPSRDLALHGMLGLTVALGGTPRRARAPAFQHVSRSSCCRSEWTLHFRSRLRRSHGERGHGLRNQCIITQANLGEHRAPVRCAGARHCASRWQSNLGGVRRTWSAAPDSMSGMTCSGFADDRMKVRAPETRPTRSPGLPCRPPRSPRNASTHRARSRHGDQRRIAHGGSPHEEHRILVSPRKVSTAGVPSRFTLSALAAGRGRLRTVRRRKLRGPPCR